MLCNPRKTFFKATCFLGVSLTLIKDRLELIKFHNRREYQEFFSHFLGFVSSFRNLQKKCLTKVLFKVLHGLLLVYLPPFSSTFFSPVKPASLLSSHLRGLPLPALSASNTLLPGVHMGSWTHLDFFSTTLNNKCCSKLYKMYNGKNV